MLSFGEKRNIAIFGGTFNPVHNGHIAIARCLVDKKMVDEVWIMPSYASPHKTYKTIDTYDDRVEMLNIAFSNEKAICISTFEKDYCVDFNIDKSYSAKILKALSEKEKNVNFKFVLGFDSVKRIEKWYESEYLINNYEFIVFDRLDDDFDTVEKKKEILDNIGNDKGLKFRYTYIEENVPCVSSTELKILFKNINDNKNEILKYIPLKVYNYIVDNNLYKYEND